MTEELAASLLTPYTTALTSIQPSVVGAIGAGAVFVVLFIAVGLIIKGIKTSKKG